MVQANAGAWDIVTREIWVGENIAWNVTTKTSALERMAILNIGAQIEVIHFLLDEIYNQKLKRISIKQSIKDFLYLHKYQL